MIYFNASCSKKNGFNVDCLVQYVMPHEALHKKHFNFLMFVKLVYENLFSNSSETVTVNNEFNSLNKSLLAKNQ